MCLARKLKSVKERKRRGFREVLIENVYPVENKILIAVGYKICLSTIRSNRPILFIRWIENLETNDAFKHNLDLKEFLKQIPKSFSFWAKIAIFAPTGSNNTLLLSSIELTLVFDQTDLLFCFDRKDFRSKRQATVHICFQT